MSGFAELHLLEQLCRTDASGFSVQTACKVEAGDTMLPVYTLTLGSARPDAPAVGFFGGVHGLERIGTQVLLAFMQGLVERLRWDDALQECLDGLHLVFMPLINPNGMDRCTRCNGRGVDLMRNAPVDADQRVPFLLGGQRISRRLPWYRGGGTMEAESDAVCRVVRSELLGRPFSISLDCHSGFGLRDRIWFPYAHSKTPIAHLPELFALRRIFTQAHPHHDYVFEPQSRQYLTHGDLWDHLYLQALREHQGTVFLPLTLEMGSWRWISKRPTQLLSRLGFFNPLPPHRHARVLRRHLVWLDFLLHAAGSFRRWLPQGEQRAVHRSAALSHWYSR